MQVYACVYDAAGNFCVATKPKLGYFFSTKGGGGTIVKAGQALNGGGLNALPGGKLDVGESIPDGAAREWHEEANSPIAWSVQDDNTWPAGFACAYFLVGPDDLIKILDVTSNTVLVSAAAAVTEIIGGTITTYSDIFAKYPDAPADNELDSMTIWNVGTDWKRILQWAAGPQMDWYGEMMAHLRFTILGMK